MNEHIAVNPIVELFHIPPRKGTYEECGSIIHLNPIQVVMAEKTTWINIDGTQMSGTLVTLPSGKTVKISFDLDFWKLRVIEALR